MLGKLNETQINNLLSSQAIGRIGCSSGTQPYIVPVTYVFDGKYIYGQTHEGMKLEIMRENPTVCFQVDILMDMANWQSVLVIGSFEELTGDEARKGRALLLNRIFPLQTSSTVHAHEHEITTQLEDSNRVKPLMYRILIKEKTGRFEKR